MNGTNRLYRSTSDAMVGGVAAGLANYFKVDPTLFRLGFAAATFFTGGAFLFVYAAMWLLVPTVGSTAADAGAIVNENLGEIGNKVRSFVGSSGSSTPTGSGNGNGNGAPAGNTGAAYSQEIGRASCRERVDISVGG